MSRAAQGYAFLRERNLKYSTLLVWGSGCTVRTTRKGLVPEKSTPTFVPCYRGDYRFAPLLLPKSTSLPTVLLGG